MMLNNHIIHLLIFIFGSIIGSFLNVCIYRIPRNESIIFPGSRCPSCKKAIEWYDNIPFLSYIFLRARCRSCGSKISFRYFAVELISAVCFLILFMNFGITQRFWIYSIVTFSLIVVTFIDLGFQIIPDRITIGGMLLGVIFSIFLPELHNVYTWRHGLMKALSGGLAGAGAIYITGVLGKMAFKKESMGGGDVKLMAMLGVFLGWEKALLIFFLAPFFGVPAGLYLKLKTKTDIIPYGPFLSMASFTVMMWGQDILSILFF